MMGNRAKSLVYYQRGRVAEATGDAIREAGIRVMRRVSGKWPLVPRGMLLPEED